MSGFEAASVSDLISSIKDLLEEQYQEVMVEGEVSNFSQSASGHYYFNLSDAEASLSCALFRNDALRNPLAKNLKEGDKVLVLGPISVYQKKGSFQLITKRLLPAGSGMLKLQFERLKAKLAQEGLFDIDKKKPIPKFPHKIALITAEHGAALQDFLNVIKRRSLWFDIVIIPSLVQGESAPQALMEALEKAKNLKDIDLIVITRGGGSSEDLWCFNDENFIRSAFACSIPIVSAIGHEVDYTLLDYVADYRAETPTAAAEIISQPQLELEGRIQYCRSHLNLGLNQVSQKLALIKSKTQPREMLSLVNRKLSEAQKNLSRINLVQRSQELIGLYEIGQRVDEAHLKMAHLSQIIIGHLQMKLERLEHVLLALDPRQVLKRGYAIIKSESGKIISGASQWAHLSRGTMAEIHFSDGTVKVRKEDP